MIRARRIKRSADFLLNRLLIVFFFTLIVVYASREIVDLDIWLHVKTGEVILKNMRVPLTDIFSFTLGPKPWINHEWFFQVISYISFLSGGGDGLIFMQNVVVLCTFFLLFFMGLKKENHIFVFVVLYLTLMTVAYRFTVRPDVFSLFFLVFYLFVLKRFSSRGAASLWLLPLCQALWVNMHGFFFTGPLVLLIFLVGEIIRRTLPLPLAWNKTQRYQDRQLAQLLTVFALVVAASLINPCGLKGASYPLSVLGQISGKGRIVFQYIQELARPIAPGNIFDLHYFLFYKIMILASLFSFRINQKNINVADLILWLFFLFFSLLAIRNVAYFGIVAAYCIFNNVGLAVDHGKTFPKPGSAKIQGLATYALIGSLFYFPAATAWRYAKSTTYDFESYKLKSGLWGIAQQRYPREAVKFLLKDKFPERMFNDFNSGAYLIGQAYPARQVFIDGRTELYGPEFFSEYVDMGEGKRTVIDKALSRYSIKGFFLTNSTRDLHTGLVTFLYKHPAWKVVYFDEHAIIFLKDSKENAALIKKYAIDLERWMPPEPDFVKLGIAQRFPSPYLTRGRLLNSIGCYEAAAREARIALTVMPTLPEAMKFIQDYHFEKKEYLEAFKYARNSLIYSGGDLWMRARLALIYHRLQEEEKALKVIDSIIKHNPKYPQGYYIKALILRENDIDGAVKLLRKAVELAPKNPRYHETLGDLLYQKAKPDDAEKEWAKALEYDGANAALQKKIQKL